jgi:hypothetical protein
MSITRNNPNTIFLGGQGDITEVGDIACAAVITPGHLVQIDNTAGVIRWKVAAADIVGPQAVALDQPELNNGVEDTYAVGDLARVAVLKPGQTAWMLIASGQNVEAGDLLGSSGTGTLKTGATISLFTALENKPNVTVQTRIRVQAN